MSSHLPLDPPPATNLSWLAAQPVISISSTGCSSCPGNHIVIEDDKRMASISDQYGLKGVNLLETIKCLLLYCDFALYLFWSFRPSTGTITIRYTTRRKKFIFGTEAKIRSSFLLILMHVLHHAK